MRSYCGASRFAYNWTIAQAKENLEARSQERQEGIADDELTKSLSWTPWSITPLWNSVKDEVAPWHRDVTMHTFRGGVTNATVALKNFSESRSGARKGPPAGFPKFKNRRSKMSVTFTETKVKSQVRWFADDSHHVRLILPARATDPCIARRREQLQWLHTTESLRRLKKKVTTEEWSVQALTISSIGGRWRRSRCANWSSLRQSPSGCLVLLSASTSA